MLNNDTFESSTGLATTVLSAEKKLTDDKRNQMLFDWNSTKSEYPPCCVHELFEQQAASDPSAIALVHGDQQWSYSDLNRGANQVARHLRKLGVGPDVLVGVLLERSFNLVAALLGVWKAGGAYVPLDPSYPAERISFMLADAGVKIVLTEEKCRPMAPASAIFLDSGWPSIAPEEATDLDPLAGPGNLAYVMYTSGSTGKPKGAMIQHGGLVNYLCWAIEAYGIQAGDSVPVHTSISFDLTVTSLYTPLLAGGQVELLPDAMGAQNLIDALRRRKNRGLVKITPAHLELLSQQLDPAEMAGMTRTFVIGGENLLAESLQLWRESAPGTRLINEYGPTETVVGCCVYEVRSEDPATGSIPIGRPIANTQLYVLDDDLQPVAPGVMGELYIGGAGVARGYFQRPELTEERFLPDPFSGKEGARLYKTGDFARYRLDGVLEYLGRIDNQVKVRGYRIELGEIEATLANHPEVRSCVVVAREDVPGDKQLVGYVIPRNGIVPEFEELRSFLTQRLPEYMAPGRYVVVDAFPLTQNGKVDRNALPAPDAPAMARGAGAAPRDPVEQQLADLWAKLLRVRNVGIHDDFFKLGGHSLLAVRMFVELEKLGFPRLPLTALAQAPTVAKLAEVLSRQDKRLSQASVALPQVQADLPNRYQPFALNSIQQAYMIGRSDGVELGNIPCQSYNEVDMTDWDRDRFEDALNKVIERHEMLRCVVLKNGDQQILPKCPRYKIQVDDLSELDPAAKDVLLESTREEMVRSAPDPDQWPLFEFRASQLDEHTVRLHIRIDLLIGDGRSYEILFSELMEHYGNPAASLPALDLSFRDYLTAQNSLENSAACRDAQQYWLQRAPSFPAAPDLPLVKNPAAISRPVFRRRMAKVDAETWRSLKERGAHRSATPSGILLAAYAEILTMWSKNPRFTVNLALFNRLPLHAQANNIIGDFTSVSLLEIDNSSGEPFATRVVSQQQQLWRDLDHRYFSGIQVMRELRRLQGVGPKAIMPVVFTSLLNLDDQGEGTTWSYRIGNPAFTITQTPQVYLDFIVQEDEGTLILNWDAVDELFADGMLDDMFTSFQRLLRELAAGDAAWDRSFANSALALLPPEQLEIRRQANATGTPISDELLHTPFFKQVEERPGQVAISTPNRRLSYAETYQLACRVEQELLHRGLTPNQMVGVLMAKGWEQVVAVLGIHFAGAAYLPIDSELPVERQRYLMENSDVKVVLIQSDLQARLDVPKGVDVLAVDTMKPLESVPPVPRRRQKPEDLAYIIYTSGSTGLPKGVMIDHRGAMNTVLDINRRFAIGPQDRVLALSRLNFDLSVYDVFGLLAAGGAIVFPAPELAQDPSHWAELIVSERVTVWNTVPALMQLMTEEAGRKGGKGIGSTLRLVMMSGDWIPVNLPGQIQRLLPEAAVISMGGATEASIWSIMYPIEKVDPNWKSVPYGKPMANQTFHVLNRALAPSPVWVPGLLHIGGIGVAKGYFGDAKKTSASFIQHPVTGERLYRTGDLGRYLPDGNIEFLGREDFQVKIQGYRIELGEIEVRLQEFPGVDNCAVIVREDNPGEKRLVGYAVPQEGVQLEVSAVREYLRAKLPEYMIPAAFVILDRFPLTANGKVDRKALPAPVRATHGKRGKSSSEDFLEAQLTHLWEKMLGVRPVGPDDNFFELGGTSMMAVRLFTELKERFGRSLSLSTLFQAPTVAKIAEILRSNGYTPSWASLVPIQPGGSKPPFYCVHGAGGNVLMFRELAERMAPDVPFYGLQARGLDGSKNYLKTVEEMAAAYLKEIRQFQPEGPYFLGGFCLGGQIAFEMAQLLKNEGERVALLAVIDTYNFHGERVILSLRENVSRATEKVTFHFLNVISLGVRQQGEYLLKKFKGAYIRESDKLKLRISNFFHRGDHIRATDDGMLEELNEQAHFSYVTTPYDGNAIVFKAKKNYSYLHDPKLGWGDVLTGPVEFIELPVNPGGLFIEPYVDTLAEKLKAKIDQAESQNVECDVAVAQRAVAGS